MERRPEVPVLSPTSVPDSLLNAFWSYDAALLSNDQAVLTDLFEQGSDTIRGDGRSVLVGHEAITSFRSARARIPTRHVERLHVRLIADDAAVVLAETRDGEATGLQTQVWRQQCGHWRVAIAHVSLPVLLQ